LNGSKFNFLILSTGDYPPKLDRVILGPRPEGGFVPLPPAARVQDEDPEDRDPASMNLQPVNRTPAPVQVPKAHEAKPPADENNPNQ